MHPARHFILYLLTGNITGKKDKWVHDFLGSLDLFPDLLTTSLLQDFKEQARPPEGYDATKKTNQKNVQFWRGLRIFDMHVQTPTAKKAHEILVHPPLRDMAEPLLLSRTPFAEVAKILNRRFQKMYKAEDVATFYHYFFEVDAISRTRWYDTLKERKSSPILRSSLDGNSQVTRWRMGDEDGLVFDFRSGLEDAFKQCVMRIKELGVRPTTIETAKTLNLLVDALMRTNQGLVDAETEKSDMIKKLTEFRQARKPIPIQSVQALGAHSGYNKGLDEGIEIMVGEPAQKKEPSKANRKAVEGDV